MTQTNAEKSEAIARRKQKDRDRAAYHRKQVGPAYAGPKYDPPAAGTPPAALALEDARAPAPRVLTAAELDAYVATYGRPAEDRAATIARLQLAREFAIR